MRFDTQENGRFYSKIGTAKSVVNLINKHHFKYFGTTENDAEVVAFKLEEVK